MQIYYGELSSFIKFLYNLNLVDKASRMRTKLIRLLDEKYNLLQEDLNQLILKHVCLDENDEPIIIQDGENNQYQIRDKAEFNKDYNDLLNKTVVVNQTEEHREMLISVRESVLNCGLHFTGDEAVKYERWADILDQVK